MRRKPTVLGFVAAITLTSLAPAQELKGVVRDASTGEVIRGAMVRIQAAPERVLTDAQGAFSLPAAPGARVVAGARGYYYAGATAADGPVEFRLDAVPHDPDVAVPLLEPFECAACHPTQHAEWQGSAMAHAGRNSWVADLYDGSGTPGGTRGFVYVRDSVTAQSNPASECAACHQPEAWVEEPFSPLRSIDDSSVPVSRGVSCLVCHLVREVDETRPNFPGFYPGIVDLNRGAVVRFGVLGDVDYNATARMRASYQPQLPSAVCGVCHQDKNDPSGQHRFDGVTSEPTYLEWLASPYADPESPFFSSCMGCHSNPAPHRSASPLVDYTPGRPLGDVRTHRFEGTTPAFLENAVELRVRVERTRERLLVDVDVINRGAGHHVPTGVTTRNVILLVTAKGPQGPLVHRGSQLVDALGGIGDPGKGYFAGQPGKLYAKVNQGVDGAAPVLFTEAANIREDTRIPALGVDHTRYEFIVSEPGSVSVEARVIYRRAWRALIDEKGWEKDGHGRPLADLEAPHFGHLMASQRVELEVEADDERLVPGGGGCRLGSRRRGETRGVGAGLCLGLFLLARRRTSRPAFVLL